MVRSRTLTGVGAAGAFSLAEIVVFVVCACRRPVRLCALTDVETNSNVAMSNRGNRRNVVFFIVFIMVVFYKDELPRLKY